MSPSGMDRGRCDASADEAVVRASTPFDDLEAHAVLRPKEIAERPHVDARSVRRAIARGDLPASRACGLRVLAEDAAAWWRSRAVVPPEAPVERTPAPSSRVIAPPARRRRVASGARLPLPPRGGGA